MRLLLPLLFLTPALCAGHSSLPPPGPSDYEDIFADGSLSAYAGISTTYRSDTALPDEGVWQIPGVLMGGGAHGVDQRFALDDASVHLRWFSREGVRVLFDAGSHHGEAVAIEQAAIGYRFTGSWQPEVTMGRLKAAFSEENQSHSFSRSFSETNPVYSAFYGGHFVDEGLRLEASPGYGVTLGVETWTGTAFPATPGEQGGAHDIYIRWQGGNQNLSLGAGVWGMMANARDRADDRNNSDHSHGGVDTETQDLRFDGDQDSAGLTLQLTRHFAGGFDWNLSGEMVAVEVAGVVRDTTRAADLTGDYHGFWIRTGLEWQRQSLSLQYARIIPDNHLTGPAAAALATKAGLMAKANEPDWLGVSYRYRLADNLGLRLEWTQNQLGAENSDYLGLGFYWSRLL